MILAGDLGGTKANLGLFDIKAGKLVRVADRRYATQQHSGLEEIASDFLNGAGAKITAASFGIAGPVVNNRVQATNFPWVVDGASVATHLHLNHVRLVNDVEAAAYPSQLVPASVATCSNWALMASLSVVPYLLTRAVLIWAADMLVPDAGSTDTTAIAFPNDMSCSKYPMMHEFSLPLPAPPPAALNWLTSA